MLGFSTDWNEGSKSALEIRLIISHAERVIIAPHITALNTPCAFEILPGFPAAVTYRNPAYAKRIAASGAISKIEKSIRFFIRSISSVKPQPFVGQGGTSGEAAESAKGNTNMENMAMNDRSLDIKHLRKLVENSV